MASLKKNITHSLIDGNPNVHEEFYAYVNQNKKLVEKNKLAKWKYLSKLKWHYQIQKKETWYDESLAPVSNADSIRYYLPKEKRMSQAELCEKLSQYDVISFDIFDTALYRKVEKPNDIFFIMSMEIGHNDFINIRKKSENEARNIKNETEGHREVTLDDIYDVMSERYGIEKKWKERECELEIEASIQNPYIYGVYRYLKDHGKTVVFTSDMYLPKSVITAMLNKNGYNDFDAFYLSNEMNLQKGNGTLQKYLLETYKDKKIIHIGDNYASDYEKSIKMGLEAYYNPSSEMLSREADMDNISGSFYRALVNTSINNGTWDNNLFYEHGFRVGGILTTGYCQFINRIAKENGIDKILFCARDCEVIWKAYNQNFKEVENEYVQISRYSLMKATSDRYMYDLSGRYIMRYMNKNKSKKTIESILIDSGFEYLVPYLEDDDIDRFMFPSAIGMAKIENFIFSHKKIIVDHCKEDEKAAIKYFGDAIGNAKNVLIVDIGWTGTCITALKYFINTHFANQVNTVKGTLMCSSRNIVVSSSITSNEIYSYVYSPFENMDLTRFMMPAKATTDESDLLHMPLEFMFTSTDKSLASYKLDDNGEVVFERIGLSHNNEEEIVQMQAGILDFCEKYMDFYSLCPSQISSYVAFNPLMLAIKNIDYLKSVYGNFSYDAFTAPFEPGGRAVKFETLFKTNSSLVYQKQKGKKSILFVSPEMVYTGAPRSLLRMCKVARSLGYDVNVWTTVMGPFVTEYEKNGFAVEEVPESQLTKLATIDKIKSFDLAICNTIVTNNYAKVCSCYIPTVWYIREATNIPDFTRDNQERKYILTHSKDICCVSDYASKAISEFTPHKIMVIHNSVEDEVDMATSYVAGTGDTVKFVQFGTMEYRKGYDVLLSAYKAMPKEYRDKSELYFAGGFINSGTPFCSYLFSEMEGVENVHYLGTVRGEENKIKTLSQMDVVVVASRDESCSLVALEGAMLSKPVIVTENTGAKYIVGNDNGAIVKTADVDSLKDAMMEMIDQKDQLAKMGEASRVHYEKQGSMVSYTADLKRLYSLTDKRNSFGNFLTTRRNRFVYSNVYRTIFGKEKKQRIKSADVVVSMTSHPGRIHLVSECLETLLVQTCKPYKIILWLSKVQFPKEYAELPQNLLDLKTKYSHFEIRFVEDDMAPHKKYLYAMKEFSEKPVIIVDDDVIYEPELIEKLVKSYKKNPHCISCMRANLITFRPNGSVRVYKKWIMDYKALLDTPSYQLMPTGIGGVLYPPHSMDESAFDINAIKDTCLFADDIWLKFYAVYKDYPTIIPRDYSKYKEIEEAQETALWRKNVTMNKNDVSFENVTEYFKKLDPEKDILSIMRRDRFL